MGSIPAVAIADDPGRSGWRSCGSSARRRPGAESLSAGATDRAEGLLALVRRAQRGEPRAREELFGIVLALTTRCAAGRIGTARLQHLDPADVAQDAALRFFRRLARFQPRHDQAVAAYLRRIVANRILDEIRRVARHRREDERVEDLVSLGATPLDRTLTAERGRRLREAVEQLTPRERALLESRFGEGQRYAEIACRHGKPSADAARVAVRRAIQRLRAVFIDGQDRPLATCV